MDLPTYTNIWRIEKRLYKLYDLRLPMPLPVVWIGVFVGVSVPWWVFLYLIGLPFAAPWHVIYLVPPGVLTWLSTRPVIESKRLTELLQSQLRYMSEPRTWCRMAPFDEPDEIAFTARVWRTTPPAAAAHGRAARKARRAVSVKVPVPKVSRTGVRRASGTAARVGAHQVDPSRVVRPAVAAAAAAAAPVTDTPATPSRSSAAARAGAAGERVFYLTEPSVPPVPPVPPAPPQVGHVTGPDRERDPHEGHSHEEHSHEEHGPHEAPAGYESHEGHEGHELGSVQPAPPAEAEEEAPAVPPIGTETLRRLRRLAASAEPRAVRPSGVTSFMVPGEPAAGEPAHEERPHDERAHDAEAGGEGTGEDPGEGTGDRSVPDPVLPADTAGAPQRPEAARPDAHENVDENADENAGAQPGTAEYEQAPGELPEAPSAPQEPADSSDGLGHPAQGNTAKGNTAKGYPAQRDAEALEQHRKGRPPRLVRPRVPGGAWGEAASEVPAATGDTRTDESVTAGRAAMEAASAAAPSAGAETSPADAVAPRAVAEAPWAGAEAPSADAATEHPPAADASAEGAEGAEGAAVPGAPTWIGAHAARTGTHAPGSRPYESAGARVPGASTAPAGPGMPAEPSVPTGKGDVTPPPAGPAGVSIRAVPAGPRAVGPAGPAGPARPPLPATGRTAPGRPAHEEPPRLRRVEAVVGRDTSGGWRRLAQVVVGGSRTDGMEIDEARTRIPLSTSKRIMVLGCTGGAGQTTTALMLGHTLARYREDRVLALDANTGEDTLTTRIAAESPETLSSLIESSEEVTGYLGMRAYTTRCESGLEVVGADTDDRVTQRLAERAFLADWRRTLAALDRHYRLTVIDPAAALAARLLPYADQLVLVAPASEDASEAVAMTYEWLDGHGCSDLRRRAVMVINGVSRRSLPDVEQAEAVASGRCRAIVRVPWEDELAPGRPGPVDVNHLRMGGRRAYVALAGVIVSGLAAVQAKQEVAR
ncbi:TcpE family conjugal transfer membrane protein [Microbispora sp. NPDC046933]|uniref:TcpE family conjugal transfer membrane protein n=1 Tax=Microbispora sp. NPDC046933 TaxID=3155618 RepID=UPI0033D0AE4D